MGVCPYMTLAGTHQKPIGPSTTGRIVAAYYSQGTALRISRCVLCGGLTALTAVVC